MIYNAIYTVERIMCSSPRSRRFTNGITRSVAGTVGKPNLRFPRIRYGDCLPLSRPCNNRLLDLGVSMQVARHIAKLWNTRLQTARWHHLSRTRMQLFRLRLTQDEGRVVARSKEHHRYFVSAHLPWKIDADDMEMLNNINVVPDIKIYN